MYLKTLFEDRAEGHDFWERLWLFFSPFLFPPKIRGRKNSKNRDQMSCLSGRSFWKAQTFPWYCLFAGGLFLNFIIGTILDFPAKTLALVLVQVYMIIKNVSSSTSHKNFLDYLLPVTFMFKNPLFRRTAFLKSKLMHEW